MYHHVLLLPQTAAVMLSKCTVNDSAGWVLLKCNAPRVCWSHRQKKCQGGPAISVPHQYVINYPTLDRSIFITDVHVSFKIQRISVELINSH